MQEVLAAAAGLKPVFAVLAAVAAALLLARIVREATARIFRRVPRIREVISLGRNPLRMVLSLIGIRIALGATAVGTEWFGPVNYLLTLALIASLGWLAVVALLIVETVILRRRPPDLVALAALPGHGCVQRIRALIPWPRRGWAMRL